MENKFKLYPNKIVTAICGISFALVLSSCSGNVAENKVQENETIENTQTEVTSQEENINNQEEKDSAATTAIEIMLEEGEKLKDSASNAANSEQVQEELDRSMQNLKDLTDFVFNGSEINGVTFSELSDKGKESAMNALSSLDDTINYLVPDYKERFKDWFTDSAAKGLDALDSLKDKGLELWDEIKSKRNSK